MVSGEPIIMMASGKSHHRIRILSMWNGKTICEMSYLAILFKQFFFLQNKRACDADREARAIRDEMTAKCSDRWSVCILKSWAVCILKSWGVQYNAAEIKNL